MHVIVHYVIELLYPCQWGLEYADCIHFREVMRYDTKLHLLELQEWSLTKECGIPLHLHNSNIHSHP